MNRQCSWVLSQLKAGNKLSSRDAVKNYGIQDLPKRISELRRIGYKIEFERIDGINAFGGKTHWHVYWMEDE